MPQSWGLCLTIQELTINEFDAGEVHRRGKERHQVVVIRGRNNMEKYRRGFKEVRHRRTLFTGCAVL
jgi:hypothetical protein